MSAEDRRRVSAEMMARIDAVVSGHGTQRSREAEPEYIPRIHDGPLRFDDERDDLDGMGRPIVDGSEATAAFFEGVDRARRRFAPGGIVASGGLISADTPYLVGETGPETRTASRDAYEGTLRGWLDRIVDAWGSAGVDARLRFLALLDRDDR